MPNFIATIQQHKLPITIAELAKDNAMICVVGHLGKDPETRFVGANNLAKCSGSLAVSWGKRGEDQTTEWVSWNAWRDAAEALQSMSKGDAVLLIGKCESRPWTDKDGNPRESHELTVYSVALPIYKRKDAGFSKPPASRQPESELPRTQLPEQDDDIPFGG